MRKLSFHMGLIFKMVPEDETKNGLFKCPLCNKTYRSLDVLRQHCNRCRMNNEEEISLKCNFCGAEMPSLARLRLHELTAHNDLRERCSLCAATFTFTHGLKRHVQYEHLGVRYECKVCGTQTSSKSNLTQHMKIHSGGTLDQCPICGSKYRNLKEHVLAVHGSVRGHKCAHCTFATTTATVLRRHVLAVHEGRKDHKCGQCSRSFTFLGSLNTHVKAVRPRERATLRLQRVRQRVQAVG